jgi:hypothetical protein
MGEDRERTGKGRINGRGHDKTGLMGEDSTGLD